MPFYMWNAKDNIGSEEAFKKIVDMTLENNKKWEENFDSQSSKFKIRIRTKKRKNFVKR